MVDFQDEFKTFDEKIKLTESKKASMRISRNAIKKKIINYFKDHLEITAPIFTTQGSFVINTALNPIENEEVDMDYGVYLQDQSENEEDWITPRKAHKRIIDALEGHTQDECISKTSCVRVLYRNFYHLDLPVYIMKNDKAFLAQTECNEWINSDSKEFRNWFYENRNDVKLSKMVRLIKAWRDFTKTEMTSIEITILTVNCFNNEREREDLVLYDTVANIYDEILISRKVEKPVSPFEDLWENYSEDKKDEIIEMVKQFRDDLNIALSNTSNHRGSVILREVFGERFPLKKDEENGERYRQQLRSGVKPWGV